ncbi:hypothetical protein FACS1894113_4960 [Alphaproteobacteria bacterium]|nr:hypothetical protein FACS1894113_4960 [Alphaproteobacteria bacterium]
MEIVQKFADCYKDNNLEKVPFESFPIWTELQKSAMKKVSKSSYNQQIFEKLGYLKDLLFSLPSLNP